MLFFPGILSAFPCYILMWWDSNPLGVSLVPSPSGILLRLFFPLCDGWDNNFSCPRIPFTLARTSIIFLHCYTIGAHMCPVGTYDVRQSLFLSTLWIMANVILWDRQETPPVWALTIWNKTNIRTPITQGVSNNLIIYPEHSITTWETLKHYRLWAVKHLF